MVMSLMNKFLLSVFIVLLSLGAAHTNVAQANTILFFAPQRVDLNDKKNIEEIRLTNTSDIARSYTISLQNLIMVEAGNTVPVDDFEYSAKRMVRFVPRRFDLSPGKTQIIRVMSRVSPDTPDGEYHAHMEFLENTKRRAEINQDIIDPVEQARMAAQISYAAAIPVTISKGNIKTTLNMKDARIKINEQGDHQAFLTIERSGNGQGKLFLEADYIAPDGSVVQAASRRNVYVYRELAQRKHSFVMDLLRDKTIDSQGSIRIKLFNREASATDPVQEIMIPLSS